MQCNILKNLYIKSNGDIRCDDDYGERVLLGHVNAEQPFSPDVLFSSEPYATIRQAFSQNRAPWGKTCQQCALYRSGDIEDTIAGKHINKLQLEPTLLCNLRCPACSRVSQIKVGRTPLVMSEALILSILTGLKREGYKVQTFELCGQGEPLNHPSISRLISLINFHYPSSNISLVTNGNFDATAKLRGCRISELIVAIDGAFQSSYEQYRVNGDLETCLEFLKSSRALFPKARIIWKYVLFSHNDSDNEVITAQRLAADLHVDELRFVHTSYGPSSDRITRGDNKYFPLIFDKATIYKHPIVSSSILVLTLSPLSNSWFQKLTSFLGPKIKNRLWPSVTHKIEKAILVRNNSQWYFYIDGRSSSTNLYIHYQGQMVEPRKQFTAQYATWADSLFRLFGIKVSSKHKLIGFRAAFELNAKTVPSGLFFHVETKYFLYRSITRYHVTRPSI